MDVNIHLYLVLNSCLFALVSSIVLPGRCPVVRIQQDFDKSKYQGRWYEIRSYFTIREQGVNCSMSDYTVASIFTMNATITGTVYDAINKRPTVSNSTGILYPSDYYTEPAKLLFTFDRDPDAIPPEVYWIIETDYTGFSIVWGCSNIAGGLAHRVTSRILSRNQAGFSGQVEAIIGRVLAVAGVDATLYHSMVQTSCLNY